MNSNHNAPSSPRHRKNPYAMSSTNDNRSFKRKLRPEEEIDSEEDMVIETDMPLDFRRINSHHHQNGVAINNSEIKHEQSTIDMQHSDGSANYKQQRTKT